MIAWAGMRGVVTLARRAGAAPGHRAGDQVTYPRDLFIFIAFAVIVVHAGRLQGPTLPLLARRLKLPARRPEGGRAGRGGGAAERGSRAAKERLEATAEGAPANVVDRLRQNVMDRTNAAWERLGGRTGGRPRPRRTVGCDRR